MKPTKTVHHPYNFLFFDTETKDEYQGKVKGVQRHKLWFGYVWAFHYRDGSPIKSLRKRFTTSEQFFNIVKSRLDKEHPLYIFAHNIPFDLTQINFWHQIDTLDIKTNYVVLEDPPLMLSLTWNEARIVILDTFNYWKCSVAQMGESLKIKKYKLPSYSASKAQWDRYCLRDVEVIANQVCSLIDFLNEDHLGSFGMSAPSVAMSCYKKSFMTHQIYLHDRNRVLQLERSCYTGGYVNNFFIGKSKGETLYHTDVNSLYPYVMQLNYPVKLLDDYKFPNTKILKQLGQEIGGCAYVTIKTDTKTYPKRHNNRLCFVLGQFDTFLCGMELQRAYFAGHVHTIKHLSLYELAPIFKSYVDYFWKKRLDYRKRGDHVRSTLMKLFMNSLYGKFGMKGNNWREFNKHTIQDYYEIQGLKCPDRYLKEDFVPIISGHTCEWYGEDLIEPVKLRYLGGKLELRFPTGEHSESFCAIAAFVTSYARDLLNQYITVAGSKQVMYCDTDSLFVTEKGFKRLNKQDLINDYELGKLKLEGKSNQWSFYGPKDYTFSNKVVMKGIKKNATKINETTYEQDQFEGLKSVFKRGSQAFIYIKRIRKTNKRILTKGVLGKDGWVAPIILHE